jgi:hypothetical protein
MPGVFNLLDELADPVQAEAGAQAHVAGSNLKRRNRRRLSTRAEGRAQEIIDDRSKRPPGPPNLGLEPGGDIIIERQCGAHIMMLSK